MPGGELANRLERVFGAISPRTRPINDAHTTAAELLEHVVVTDRDWTRRVHKTQHGHAKPLLQSVRDCTPTDLLTATEPEISRLDPSSPPAASRRNKTPRFRFKGTKRPPAKPVARHTASISNDLVRPGEML